ncbi:MAG: hypothetical protein ABSA33_02035 [Candidatus Micrarchaeaceae archaeon]
MDAKKKKMIFFIGSIFVAIIFLSSYAAFSSNSAKTTATTTIKVPATYFSTGSANAVISNYSDIAYVTLHNSTNYSRGALTKVISALVSNGSALNYIYANNSYEVVLSQMSAYQLKELLNKNSTLGGVTVGSTTYVTMPKSVTLYYGAQPIPVNLNSRNFSIYMNEIGPVGDVVSLSVSALLERNGTVYNNEIKVAYKPGSGFSAPAPSPLSGVYLYSGNFNAVVVNYSGVAYVTPINSLSYSNSSLINILSSLVSNGVVSKYNMTQGRYAVVLSGISAYGLQSLLYGNAMVNGTVNVGAMTYLKLPDRLTLHYEGLPLNITLNNASYPVYMNSVRPIDDVVNISVSAEVASNGSIYGNGFNVTYKQ